MDSYWIGSAGLLIKKSVGLTSAKILNIFINPRYSIQEFINYLANKLKEKKLFSTDISYFSPKTSYIKIQLKKSLAHIKYSASHLIDISVIISKNNKHIDLITTYDQTENLLFN